MKLLLLLATVFGNDCGGEGFGLVRVGWEREDTVEEKIVKVAEMKCKGKRWRLGRCLKKVCRKDKKCMENAKKGVMRIAEEVEKEIKAIKAAKKAEKAEKK